MTRADAIFFWLLFGPLALLGLALLTWGIVDRLALLVERDPRWFQ